MRRGWMGLALVGVLSACGNNDASPAKSGSGEAPPSTAAQTANATGSPAPAPAPAPAGKATGPLASMSGVARSLNDGIAAFLGGKDATASFPGWDATAKDADKLREDLKAAGATTAVHVFMELELIFQKGGKDVYYLRTGVYSSDATAMFVQFDGREPEGGKVEVASEPMDAFTGSGAPFREAGEGLLKMLQGPDCAKVPIAGPQDIAAIAPSGPLNADFTKGAEAGKGNVDKVCKAIAALGSDKVRLRVDDQSYVAKDAAGAIVGTIRGDFGAKAGKISYGLGKFRKLK